jgi:hypothetical protein
MMAALDRAAVRLGRIDTRDLVAWGTIVCLLSNTPRTPDALPLLLVVMVAIASPFPALRPLATRLRRGPGIWAAIGLAWLPALAASWWQHEDHEFIGAEWCLAMALAFAGSRPRAVLAETARWTVVAIFGCALAWKLSAPTFLMGDTFRWALTEDARFARIAAALGAGEAPWIRDALAIFMTGWTVATEGTLLLSFAAPSGSRVARLREPALFVFAASVYTIAPILGFGGLFLVLGLATTRSARWRVGLVGLYLWLVVRLMIGVVG